MNANENISDSKRIAQTLCDSRYKSGLSQDYMAMSLGVSRLTISNWERGTSCPTLKQTIQWFKIIGENPMSYFLNILYPETFDEFRCDPTDDNIKKAVHSYIDSMPIKTVKQLAFLFFAQHGSSPISIMEMMTAHLHTPMRDRINVARSVSDSYEMCLKTNTIECTDDIAPDIENLDNAIELAKQAVINGQKGYCTVELT